MLKIQINRDYLIKATTLFQSRNENQSKENVIELEEGKQWYVPNIKFDSNEITINNSEEKEMNVITNPIKEIIEKPGEAKEYQIQYKHNTYNLQIDFLVSLIFNFFKEKVEKNKNQIYQTQIELPSDNPIVMKRIKDSCERIGLRNVRVNNLNQAQEKQNNQMKTIINYHREYSIFKEAIEETKEIITIEQLEEECPSISTMKINEEFELVDKEEIRREMKEISKLPLRIKRLFNASTMNNYTMFIATRHFESFEDFSNLEIGCKRFLGNTSKFFYNPIPLTKTTREWFDHLRTLFVYSNKDNLFKEDERIVEREVQFYPNYMKEEEKKKLEEWTHLKCGEVVFDSEIDNWKKRTSVFNEKIIGRKQLLFLIEEEKGEKIGYYLNSEVVEKRGIKSFGKTCYLPTESDEKSFEFNIETNGRLKQQMNYEIRKPEGCGYHLHEKTDDGLIDLGDIVLMKENVFLKSYYYKYENDFDYHGMEPKNGYMYFNTKRILVIQMK